MSPWQGRPHACGASAPAPTLRPDRPAERNAFPEDSVVAAVVLIRAERDHIPAAAREVAGIPGVAEVYSVSGEWDLVAIIRVPQWEQIASVVTEGLAQVKGLTSTHTLVAFRVYSSEDLAGAFDMFE